jgi:hypothetical protein
MTGEFIDCVCTKDAVNARAREAKRAPLACALADAILGAQSPQLRPRVSVFDPAFLKQTANDTMAAAAVRLRA